MSKPEVSKLKRLKRRAFNWALRRAPSASRSISIGRRNLYILPTRAGAVYALLVLSMLMGAINYGNSLGFAITFTLAGLALVSMHHTHRNLLGLHISAHGTENAFAGSRLRYIVEIHNPSNVNRFGLQIFARQGPRVVGRVDAIDLAAGARTQINMMIPALARGRLQQPPLTISTRFPLGLFRAWSVLRLAQSALIYPRPEQMPPLPPNDGMEAKGRRNNDIGDDDFVGLREYRHGDSIKRIHWKRTAQHERTLISEFSREQGDTRWLTWDACSPLDTEKRLARLCGWVMAGEADGAKYGLKLPQVHIPPRSGRDHHLRCLSQLAVFGLPDETRR